MKLRSFLPARHPLLIGLLLASLASLAIGWTAGTVAASNGSHASPSSRPTAVTNIEGGDAFGAPSGVVTRPGLAQGSSSSAIAYPYGVYPSLGVAPEGTILAAGTGTADMKADGSDRTAAVARATSAALTDARTQATAMATAMGVSITGIYSVSVSSSDSYVYPVTGCAIPMPAVPNMDPGGTSTGDTSGGGSGTVTIAPAPAGSPDICMSGKVPSPTATQVVVTATVAFRFS